MTEKQPGFFDLHQKLKAPPAPAAAATEKPVEALTVSQLTALIEKAIKAGVPGIVTVRGEASNVSGRQASGHRYFTMKDAGASLNCVMWRDAAAKLGFKLEDGMEVIAVGRMALYGPAGRYQLQVQQLHPVGKGALELAFRQLQEKLAKEGLFEAERKKIVPDYPRKLVLLTSRATAALQDMLKVLRLFPWISLSLYHVPVQGEGAGEKIAAAIRHLSESTYAADAILLGRGGGSLEDLWAFNEEAVARAIAGSRIPVVTGIGHEVDCTIADLVADYHAHTPTEAARVVTQHWKTARDAVGMGETRLRRGLRALVAEARHRLAAAERHEFFRRPMDRIRVLGQWVDERQGRLARAVSGRLGAARQELLRRGDRLERAGLNMVQKRVSAVEGLAGRLSALSPQGVLERGYSMTLAKKTGRIVRSVKELQNGDRLVTRVADGEVESVVEDGRQGRLFE